MSKKLISPTLIFFLFVFCLTLTAVMQPTSAFATSYSIELSEAQEYGLGGSYNNYWDLEKNISVIHGKGEFFSIFGSNVNNARIIYRGVEGGGFIDLGQMSKPPGLQVLQVTPAILAYDITQYIKKDHLYILKTQSLGYFALYVDDIPIRDEEACVNFTLYKLKNAPTKVSVPAIPNQATPMISSDQGNQPVVVPDQSYQSGLNQVSQPGSSNTGLSHPFVNLNGKRLSFDVPPVIENGRTLVPLRAIFEALGATVGWDESTQTVTATKGSIQIMLQVGGQSAYKNGTPVHIDVPAKVTNNRTMVPLRFVSEALGAAVGWDESTQTVTITSGAENVSVVPTETPGSGKPYWVESGCRLVLAGDIIYEDQKSIDYPFISPNGNWLVYSHNTGDLILVNLTNGSTDTIYQLESIKEVDYGLHPLGWSTDSSRILFMTFYKGGFTGGNELMILDRESGNTSRVIEGLSAASWGNNGSIVTANASEMRVIDELGHTIKALEVPRGGLFVRADHPTFTPDGSKVVYNLSNGYYIHDVETNTYKNIFNLSDNLNAEDYPRVGNDGQIICADNKGVVYVYDPTKDVASILYDKAKCTYPNWK